MTPLIRPSNRLDCISAMSEHCDALAEQKSIGFVSDYDGRRLLVRLRSLRRIIAARRGLCRRRRSRCRLLNRFVCGLRRFVRAVVSSSVTVSYVWAMCSGIWPSVQHGTADEHACARERAREPHDLEVGQLSRCRHPSTFPLQHRLRVSPPHHLRQHPNP